MRLLLLSAILSLGTASLAQPVEQSRGGQRGTENSNQRPANDPAIAENLGRLVRAVEAQNDNPNAAEDRQRAKDDLEAQETMALWTVVIGLVSFGALILSTVGVILIYLTFKQSRSAARYAGIGARQSRRALQHMQTTSKAELRAYVGIEWVGVSGFTVGETPKATIKLKNFGQTPAHKFDVFSYMRLASSDEEGLFVIPANAKETPSSLPPGGTSLSHPKLGQTWTQENVEALSAGLLNAYVYGEVRYVDAFGEKRTTSFRNSFSNKCEPGLTLHCAEGNWAD